MRAVAELVQPDLFFASHMSVVALLPFLTAGSLEDPRRNVFSAVRLRPLPRLTSIVQKQTKSTAAVSNDEARLDRMTLTAASEKNQEIVELQQAMVLSQLTPSTHNHASTRGVPYSALND